MERDSHSHSSVQSQNEGGRKEMRRSLYMPLFKPFYCLNMYSYESNSEYDVMLSWCSCPLSFPESQCPPILAEEGVTMVTHGQPVARSSSLLIYEECGHTLLKSKNATSQLEVAYLPFRYQHTYWSRIVFPRFASHAQDLLPPGEPQLQGKNCQ